MANSTVVSVPSSGALTQLPRSKKRRIQRDDHDALFIARLSDGAYYFNSSRGEAVYTAFLVNGEPHCNCKGAKTHGHCWHGAFVLAHESAQTIPAPQAVPAAFTTAWAGDDHALRLPPQAAVCASCGDHATTLVDDGICPACALFDDGTRAFRGQESEPSSAGVPTEDNRPPALIAASILLTASAEAVPSPQQIPPARRCPRCGEGEALAGAILCAACQDRRTAPPLALPEPPAGEDVHVCIGGCGARALPGHLHCRVSRLGRGYCGLRSADLGGATRDAYGYGEAVWA